MEALGRPSGKFVFLSVDEGGDRRGGERSIRRQKLFDWRCTLFNTMCRNRVFTMKGTDLLCK
jgi:hypothetical protein